MINSCDNDSLIFDMQIMMKMISPYYHSILPRFRAVRSHEIASACANSVRAYATLVEARFFEV